jgi:chromosome segregation ATPase
MTLAEMIQTGAVISGVFVAVGTFLLSFRSTSFTELKTLFTEIKAQLTEAEEKIKDYEKRVEVLQAALEAAIRQNDNFKRYIARLIAQLEANDIIPEKMDG